MALYSPFFLFLDCMLKILVSLLVLFCSTVLLSQKKRSAPILKDTIIVAVDADIDLQDELLTASEALIRSDSGSTVLAINDSIHPPIVLEVDTLFSLDSVDLEQYDTLVLETETEIEVIAVHKPGKYQHVPVVDFAPDYDDATIEARMLSVESGIPLRFDDNIRLFIDYFAIRNRDYTRKMMRRAEAYFPIMEEILAKNNMPESIKYLSIVESGLDPKIRSWAGAMGLWQFMPATGRAFDLRYDYYIDERLDPYKSTDAACKYLKQLYHMFDDWELALGAYNCGPGNMRKAIRKSGGKKTFAEVYDYLPKETRSYVPQFMAVNYVMRYTDAHNLFIEDWEAEFLPEASSITISQYLNIEKLAELSGICKDHIIQLNPHIKRDAVSADWKDFELRMPNLFFSRDQESIRAILSASSEKGAEELNYLYRNPEASDLSKNETIYHRVRSGENLGLIARKYGVSVRNLKSWNKLRGSTIYKGQKLKIYRALTSNAPSPSTPTATPKAEQPKKAEPIVLKSGEKRIHTVAKGEVLGGIATLYNVPIASIRSWNNISGNLIKVGQKLDIYGGPRAPVVSPKNETVKEAKPQKDFSHLKTQSYVVKSGDALYKIAVAHGMKVQDLIDLNNLSSNQIKPGQKLQVVKTSDTVTSQSKTNTSNTTAKTGAIAGSSTTYTVKSGDSLWSISRQFDGLTIDKLKELNGLTSNALDVGQVLKIR